AAGDIVDRVVGLEVGADDYVTKPFDPRELLARVRALLRRSEPRAAPEPTGPRSPEANLVRFGPLFLDMEGRRLVRDDGAIVALTTMEFELLAVFSRNPNRVLTRDRLLDLAHHRGTEPFDRSIDIRVARLRRKIEPDPGRP